MQNTIQQVKDGKDKSETYAKCIIKYNKAIKYGFYFEAIMIDYAMLEDRLLSFLHHIGVVTRTHKNITINKFCRDEIRELMNYKPNSNMHIDKISTKREIIEKLLLMDAIESSKYLSVVDMHISKSIDKQTFLETLDEISKWCDIRNQYVHAMLNKNYIALQEGLCEYAERGFILVRKVDNFVKAIKLGNSIRRKFKIQ